MSLVQHVSTVEGVDRNIDFDLESFPQLGRRNSRASLALSYDPIPFISEANPEEKLPPIAAYEVSPKKRIGATSPNTSQASESCAANTL
jgi:hypothetical protein